MTNHSPESARSIFDGDPRRRSTDRTEKQRRLRALLDSVGADSLTLSSSAMLSWYLDGARLTVSAAGDPVAAMVVTQDADTLIVPANEVDRLTAEELPDGLRLDVVPWWAAPGREARRIAGSTGITESSIRASLRAVRASLLPGELARYAALCRDTAEAMTDAIGVAVPGESERALAARAAAGIVARGAEPVVVLVGGASRARHRHPVPTSAPLGARAMLVVCARRHGLISNATRWVRFDAPTSREIDDARLIAAVEADVLDVSRPGARVADAFAALRSAYPAHGFAEEEWTRHHQGGPCGYEGRDPRATDSIPDLFTENHAVAWNPSAPGLKIEDTMVIDTDGVHVLTVDSRWPTLDVRGRARPDEWVVA